MSGGPPRQGDWGFYLGGFNRPWRGRTRRALARIGWRLVARADDGADGSAAESSHDSAGRSCDRRAGKGSGAAAYDGARRGTHGRRRCAACQRQGRE